jgi:CRP/FNR family transcriptional regulator
MNTHIELSLTETQKCDPSYSVVCKHDQHINCGSCRLNTLCLPISLHLDDIEKLNSIVQRSRPLHKGDHLYRANDEFYSVYAIRSGAVKAVTISENGDEQITGFYLPGEIVGLDGLSDNRYTNSVIALETASVCEIPFHKFEELSGKILNLQRHFLQLMSREITDDQRMISLLSKSSAEARIASLLISISSRNSLRHLSSSEFSLPMTRTEIGNFLGLRIETVSRVLGRLQKCKVVSINKKDVVINDMKNLHQIAKGMEDL